MDVIHAIANTFQATTFDVIFVIITVLLIFFAYYFLPLRRVYEIAFGAVVGLGVYILLSVLLLGNVPL